MPTNNNYSYIFSNFGTEVAHRVYEYFDIQRARNHLPYDYNSIMEDINTKVYIGNYKDLMRPIYSASDAVADNTEYVIIYPPHHLLKEDSVVIAEKIIIKKG